MLVVRPQDVAKTTVCDEVPIIEEEPLSVPEHKEHDECRSEDAGEQEESESRVCVGRKGDAACLPASPGRLSGREVGA